MRTARLLAAIATVVVVGPRPSLAAEASSGAAVAKIAAAQNQVETKASTADTWAASTLDQKLFGRDRVRTGPASRATILYSDQTRHRLNEKSEIEILPPSPGSPGLLRVLAGQHYFSSRTPKDYGKIETPTVTAAIKGTEFVVDVGADQTTITMLEGVVQASNEHGSIEVRQGEQVYVEPGKAPQKRIVVQPRDAAAWAFYYPPVLGGSDAKRLEEMGPDGQALARAAEMLAAGQVEAAKTLIEEVRQRRPEESVALSLASVIEVAANRKEEAVRLAESARAADPNSAAAALALSFAAQASYDIEKARVMAEKAAQLDPESPAALARAAELRMAEGDLEGARQAAEKAVERAPDQGRALTVLGFVELAQFRSAEAENVLKHAVAADPGLALARLGLGIAEIRRGHVSEAFEQLQTAAALDPSDSIARSYLGKAYYEERRTTEASKELATAKELDPNDPTPYLYDAILKQNDNRPAEALDDLRASIARNDGRAVYRSRLLLDEDRAVRNTDLARIYNDLGFEQLGLVTARRSADQEQANASSHHFLAGNYRSLPGFARAFLSEVLQARVYQPVSVNAARPDVVNESVSFNEYSALFDRPRARAFADLTYGRTDTGLNNLIDLDRLDESETRAGGVVGTLNGDRYAGAFGYQRTSDDGFRVNSDKTIANYRGFFQWAPSYRDSVQINALYSRQETGDLPLRQVPVLKVPERFESELENIGFAYHRILSPGSDLAVSAIYNDTQQTGVNTSSGSASTATLSGPQLEAQYVVRRPRTTWIFGAGGFDGTEELQFAGGSLKTDDTFANGYVLAKIRGLGPVEITAGASLENVGAPVGLIPPRDSNILPADLEFSDTRVSPRLGVSVYLPSKTTLRAAGYYRLSPALGRIQTLEPTQVAGFNEFFEDPGGTRSFSWGAGVDQEFGSRLYAGGQYLRRDLTIPQAYCDVLTDPNYNPFSGCAAPAQTTLIVERNSDDRYRSAYLNVVLGKRVTGGIEYVYDKHDFDNTSVNPAGLFQDFIATERIGPQVRIFLPSGFFAGARGTRYEQRIDQFDDLDSPARFRVSSFFWTGDLFLGYRFPKRYGSVVLEGHNVTDREFPFFERAIQDTVIPARSVTLRASFTY